MRKLKFRVWSEKQKTYDYKHPYNTLGNFYVNQNGCLFSDFGNAVAPEVKQEDFVVEEYTGLKDKNDKDIYEGDIINFFGAKHLVIYRAGGFWVEYSKTQVEHLFLYAIDSEVIGNIHENPELLENE